MGCVQSQEDLERAEASKRNALAQKRYRIGREIGRGHFAEVRECQDRETGAMYAVKILDKKDMIKSSVLVREEIAVLEAVGRFKYIAGLIDHFEDNKEFYLVMELCTGGDLFSQIVADGKYSEKMAVRCCRQLAEALLHIHQRGVTHRDLKPENILLVSEAKDSDIKVADFGLSKLVAEEQHVMRTVCGTWAYCAPEVISRKPYTDLIDNWTLGVLTFILLSGYHPFDIYGELSEAQMLENIRKGSYDFKDPVWEDVSSHAKTLISSLLQLKPENRISLEDVLKHPWIAGEGVQDKPLPNVVERLSKFNEGRTKFRALVLAKLASKKFRNSIQKDKFGKSPKSSQGRVRVKKNAVLPETLCPPDNI